jgi:nitrogen fixation-related uncharacterized protein
MDMLLLLIVLVLGLALLDVASLTWGADSRDLIADDHRR